MYLRLHNILLGTSHLLKDDTTWTVIEGYLQQFVDDYPNRQTIPYLRSIAHNLGF